MLVLKTSGKSETFQVEKIERRLKHLLFGLNLKHVNIETILSKFTEGIYDGVGTADIDTFLQETVANLSTSHHDYSLLAGRLVASSIHKSTTGKYSEVIKTLYNNKHPELRENCSLISKEIYEIAMANIERIESAIDYSRDFDFDYFAMKTLDRAYLMRSEYKIVERPQDMFMRVSLGIHKGDIDAVLETYEMLSKKYFIHATPTLYNAGTERPQMSSCFLLEVKEDSIDGIFQTLHSAALISQSAGGIGISIHNVRAKGSYIRGTNGMSNGIVPMVRVFNDAARYVDQGSGKRKGAFAIYIEPWHSDIEGFLDLKKNHGIEELRARDLFYALWIPDLFMKRVKNDGEWSLFCPDECRRLYQTYGKEFEELYERYESEGRARKVMKAQELWKKITTSQTETGTPYMMYKDACNGKSNQQNLGVIKSSNLCTEVVEYTAPDEIAVCNLASISLPKYFRPEYKNLGVESLNLSELHRAARVLTRNLNRIIDNNYYPVPEAEKSNKRHRPIGIGVQGLADLFMLMDLPFESEEARKVNKVIFEVIYHAALTESCELAKLHGTYSTYEGSPISQGKFQFDLWGINPEENPESFPAGMDWKALKEEIKKYGVRNSLLLAPMPTASTSQILGNNECFEPIGSNIYARRTLSGDFVVVNKYLLNDLINLGLWNDGMRQLIIAHEGSIQEINSIPNNIKEKYKTSWEISQRAIIDMAADRGVFICQSQSMNLFVKEPSYGKLTSIHFYAWSKGLKTGMYYLRTESSKKAIKFSIDYNKVNETQMNGGGPLLSSVEGDPTFVNLGAENINGKTFNYASNSLENATCNLDGNCDSCSG